MNCSMCEAGISRYDIGNEYVHFITTDDDYISMISCLSEQKPMGEKERAEKARRELIPSIELQEARLKNIEYLQSGTHKCTGSPPESSNHFDKRMRLTIKDMSPCDPSDWKDGKRQLIKTMPPNKQEPEILD